jgi:hypothetical protein
MLRTIRMNFPKGFSVKKAGTTYNSLTSTEDSTLLVNKCGSYLGVH